MKAFPSQTRNMRVRLVVGCSLAALCWPVAAQAQSAPAQAPAAADDSTVADVIVTAQRREQKLQDVPIAIAAVTSDQLVKQGVTNTLDLGRSVPSLTFTTFNGYGLPRIRGVGNDVVSPGYEGGVATYIDGVYIAAAPASLTSLSNIERVEVLKGPQGTLFGRNATGGLIQIITREPSFTPSGTLDLGVDNYQTFTADTYVTGGLGGSVAADFAGHVSTQRKGYGTNRFNGQQVYRADEDIAVRSSLLFKPNDDTKIRIAGDYSHYQGSLFSPHRLAPGTGTFVGPQAPFTSTWDVDSDGRADSSYSGGGVSGRIDQQLGFAQLTSITAYRKSQLHIHADADATSTPGLNIDAHQSDKQFSQELQLASDASSKITWVLGAYYFNGSGAFDPARINFFGPLQQPPGAPFPVATAITYGRQRTEALAGYAQATAPIGAQTNLTLGIRYSTERQRLDASQFVVPAAGPFAGQSLGGPVPNKSKRYSQPTWRVSLDHRFSPELLVYASYNRGFKSGGFNPAAPSDPDYKPEKIDAYEVGFKSDLFDRHLRFNAAAFYYDYTDLQVVKYTGSVTTIYNGAAARVYGLDADFEARLTPNFTLSGGATLLHDRFTNFPTAVIAIPGPFGPVTTIGSATGNRLVQTPDFTGSVTADYHQATSFGVVGLNVSYTYNDGYFTQADNVLRQPKYDTLAATFRVQLDNGLGFRIWGKNLTNSVIAQQLTSGAFNSVVNYAPPRTYGATLTSKF